MLAGSRCWGQHAPDRGGAYSSTELLTSGSTGTILKFQTPLAPMRLAA